MERKEKFLRGLQIVSLVVAIFALIFSIMSNIKMRENNEKLQELKATADISDKYEPKTYVKVYVCQDCGYVSSNAEESDAHMTETGHTHRNIQTMEVTLYQQ